MSSYNVKFQNMFRSSYNVEFLSHFLFCLQLSQIKRMIKVDKNNHPPLCLKKSEFINTNFQTYKNPQQAVHSIESKTDKTASILNYFQTNKVKRKNSI